MRPDQQCHRGQRLLPQALDEHEWLSARVYRRHPHAGIVVDVYDEQQPRGVRVTLARISSECLQYHAVKIAPVAEIHYSHYFSSIAMTRAWAVRHFLRVWLAWAEHGSRATRTVQKTP